MLAGGATGIRHYVNKDAGGMIDGKEMGMRSWPAEVKRLARRRRRCVNEKVLVGMLGSACDQFRSVAA
jgi:hypothetical protein